MFLQKHPQQKSYFWTDRQVKNNISIQKHKSALTNEVFIKKCNTKDTVCDVPPDSGIPLKPVGLTCDTAHASSGFSRRSRENSINTLHAAATDSNWFLGTWETRVRMMGWNTTYTTHTLHWLPAGVCSDEVNTAWITWRGNDRYVLCPHTVVM